MDNKWVFRINQNLDDSIARYKARLVAKGFHQLLDIGFHETSNPVINPITVVLCLALHSIANGEFANLMQIMHFSMGILWRRSIWRSCKACDMPIFCIMFVVYTRLFMGSNKLHKIDTRSFAPSCSLSTLSHLVWTSSSLFTPTIIRSSISRFMLMI